MEYVTVLPPVQTVNFRVLTLYASGPLKAIIVHPSLSVVLVELACTVLGLQSTAAHFRFNDCNKNRQEKLKT